MSRDRATAAARVGALAPVAVNTPIRVFAPAPRQTTTGGTAWSA